MDTGEETPLDSAKTPGDSEVEPGKVVDGGGSSLLGRAAGEEEMESNSQGILQSSTIDPICSSPTTSSSSVFVTPSSSLQAFKNATSPAFHSVSTSNSNGGGVSESRAESACPPPPLNAFTKSSPTKSASPPLAAEGSHSPGMMEIPSSRSEPFHPLPDIMTALNMRPVARSSGSSGVAPSAGSTSVNHSEEEVTKVDSLGPGSKDVLIDKFKRDPGGVLNLLQSALNMDRLSGLIKQEHLRDTEVLPQLQNRLEAAYHTLKECQESKEALGVKMSQTRQKIGEKRKHLEELRGELKILGDEELKLKKQRDISHTKYSELKRRLQCSTEALQQIANITKSAHSSSSTGSSQRPGTSSKDLNTLNSGIST